jgi:hypothetical protein
MHGCPEYEDGVLFSADEELGQKEEQAKPDLKKAPVNFSITGFYCFNGYGPRHVRCLYQSPCTA